MGCVSTIDYDKWPKQGSHLGKRIQVLYNYAKPAIGEPPQGICVRDDMEEPWISIFKMNDGRYLLSIECQYGIVEESDG